jgi:hypothetical protein
MPNNAIDDGSLSKSTLMLAEDDDDYEPLDESETSAIQF